MRDIITDELRQRALKGLGQEGETAAAESAPAGRLPDDGSDATEAFCLTLYNHTGEGDPLHTVWVAGTESGTIDLMNGLVSRAADDYAKSLNAERRPGPRPARSGNVSTG